MFLNKFHVALELRDVYHQDEYYNWKFAFFLVPDIILVCFDLMDLSSLKKVKYYVSECRKLCREHYSKDVPILVVGTKLDLWEDSEEKKRRMEEKKRIMEENRRTLDEKKWRIEENRWGDYQKVVSEKDIQDNLKGLDVCGLVLCSAKTQKGLKKVFDVAIFWGLKGFHKKKNDLFSFMKKKKTGEEFLKDAMDFKNVYQFENVLQEYLVKIKKAEEEEIKSIKEDFKK